MPKMGKVRNGTKEQITTNLGFLKWDLSDFRKYIYRVPARE